MAYPTSANFKTWAGISGAADDTVVGWALARAIEWFEQYTGKVFVKATATKTIPARRPFVSRDRRTLHLWANDRGLPLWLQSVTAITNGDADVLATTEYRFMPHTVPYSRIELLKSSGLFWTDGGDDTDISIAGDWGPFATCPDDVFGAVLELTQVHYMQRMAGATGENILTSNSGVVSQPSGVPRSVLMVADNYRTWGV